MRWSGVRVVVLAVLCAAGCGRKPAAVDVLPKKIKIYGLGSTQRLNARVLDKKGQPIDPATITWSSSKNEVATVDSSGRITAKKEGSAVITATFEQISGTTAAEVVDVRTIEIVPSTVALFGPSGTRYPLQTAPKDSKGKPVAIKVQWVSTKPKVATVDSDGVVTSVAPGTASIVAKLGDLQAGCDVSIIFREIVRLELRPATAVVRAGEVQKFEVLGFGPDGKSIEGMSAIFESSDPAVANVDAMGLASTKTTGVATIRTSIGSLTAEATLLVN